MLVIALFDNLVHLQAAAAAPQMAGPWGMLDSKRFNYQHMVSYTVAQSASDATCASQITFEADGTLSIQVSGCTRRVVTRSPSPRARMIAKLFEQSDCSLWYLTKQHIREARYAMAAWRQGNITQSSDDSATAASFDISSTPVSLEGDTFEALVDGSRLRGSYDSYMVPGDAVASRWSYCIITGELFLSVLHLSDT